MSKLINYHIIRRCDGKRITECDVESEADNFTIPLEKNGYVAKHLHISKVKPPWSCPAEEGIEVIIELRKNEGA